MLSLYFVYLDLGLDTRVFVCICLLATRGDSSASLVYSSTHTLSHLLAATLATIGAAAGAPTCSNGSGTTSSLASPVETTLAPRRARSGLSLPLEAWRSELTSPGVYLLFPEGGNKHQREGVYSQLWALRKQR